MRDPRGEDDAGVPDKRLIVDESEFSRLLKIASRDGNVLSENLRQAWDGGTLANITKGRRLVATAPHISLFGSTTAAELLPLAGELSLANGLLNRFLVVCVRRAQLLPDGGQRADAGRLAALLGPAIDRARGRECPLVRDAAATRLWARIYRHCARPLPGLAGALLARAEAHLLRLSLLYALLDGAEAIGAAHLRAAVAVWRYCEESVAYLWGDSTGDPLADRALAVLLGAGDDGLTKADLHALVGGNHTGAARLNQALGVLVAQGRARLEKEAAAVGRPTERWYGVPRARRLDAWDAVLADDDRAEKTLVSGASELRINRIKSQRVNSVNSQFATSQNGDERAADRAAFAGPTKDEFTEFAPEGGGNYANSCFAGPGIRSRTRGGGGRWRRARVLRLSSSAGWPTPGWRSRSTGTA